MNRDELIERTARRLYELDVPTGSFGSKRIEWGTSFMRPTWEKYRERARTLADEGLLADSEQRDDRYAVIHVSPRPGSDAWPIVERVPGGWQSGAHHYPDEDVLDVQPLPISKHECDATLVERMRDAEGSLSRAQGEAAAAWARVDAQKQVLDLVRAQTEDCVRKVDAALGHRYHTSDIHYSIPHVAEKAAAELHQLQGRLETVRTVLDREWPDNEDHHDFVNGQVEDARAAIQRDQPAEAQIVFVVIADYGTNGASVLRVYDTHPSETTLKALPTQPSDDAPDSPSAVPGYRGLIVAPADVERDQASAPGATS